MKRLRHLAGWLLYTIGAAHVPATGAQHASLIVFSTPSHKRRRAALTADATTRRTAPDEPER